MDYQVGKLHKNYRGELQVSREAEQNVLGALLSDNRMFDEIDFLQADDFLTEEHRNIFATSKKMIESGNEVDPFLLSDKDKTLQLTYLTDLVRHCYAPKNAKAYADVVKRTSIDRKLLGIGSSISQLASKDKTTGEKFDEALDMLNNLSNQSTQKSKPQEISKSLNSVIDRIEAAYKNGGSVTGLSTGLIGLDEKTLGLHKSDFIVIAGRPSMGKTALALNMAEVAAKKNETALIFSMEMPTEQLIDRELANLGSIPLNLIRSGKLRDEHWPRLTAAFNELNGLPMDIDDSPALSIGEVRLRAKQVQREKGLGVIVIDYIQLMRGKGNNRTEEVSEISRGLKAIAKELKVPVIALSQLNRSLEARPNKRPIMSDLRESGSIEQDADLILFVYRDEYYNEESPHKGIAEINIAKQRQGETGKVFTKFTGHLCRFENYVGDIPQFSTPTRTKGFRG